jgi:hypothetical protein
MTLRNTAHLPSLVRTSESDDERHGLKELAGLDLVTATSDGPKKGIDVSTGFTGRRLNT